MFVLGVNIVYFLSGWGKASDALQHRLSGILSNEPAPPAFDLFGARAVSFWTSIMGRLKNLGSSLATLRPSVAWMPTGEQERDKARAELPWRKWYHLPEWKALRRACLLRDLFTCQRCGQVGGKLVADHKIPHRGVRDLFFKLANLWTLCKACHDGWKQREERRARP